jgi:hypothetical protein
MDVPGGVGTGGLTAFAGVHSCAVFEAVTRRTTREAPIGYVRGRLIQAARSAGRTREGRALQPQLGQHYGLTAGLVYCVT